MNYGEKVLEKVLDPGFLLIVVGAVLVYASSLLTRGVQDEGKRMKCSVAVKGVGCLVALAGAVLLFT